MATETPIPSETTPENTPPRPNLRLIYRVMIRAYMRHQMQQLPPAGEKEVKHG